MALPGHSHFFLIYKYVLDILEESVFTTLITVFKKQSGTYGSISSITKLVLITVIQSPKHKYCSNCKVFIRSGPVWHQIISPSAKNGHFKRLKPSMFR